ncbi:hypothetical protein MLD38_019972 [Melastoma candidum]|uniref:Uncharacterized protein n=1 Tax=Melastoma candidum TaxID=119954 RepID=A0ACB9QEF5_9MYRT|nr:hypothetical protein MLD38_019972 [Melastoma candidum]
MADESKDELVQLIRRFGAFLTIKFSNLFTSVSSNGLLSTFRGDPNWPVNNLKLMIVRFSLNNLQSVGAIAGFAVAVVFIWRLLRSPGGAQRRVQKRQTNSASSSDVVASTSVAPSAPGVSTASEDLRAQNVVDDFFQPVKPTLGQIVRQRLSEGRKVTCRLLGVILEENDPEELQRKATVRSSVLEVLLEITKFCDLYLMERVLDDESEKKVLLALEYAGVFTSGGLVKDKVLFCSTENGRSSFVRQLEPDWHVDTNSEIISQLARFIKYQLHISSARTERTASNVFSSPSLEQFFGSH